MSIDGKTTRIKACGTSYYGADYLKDTGIFISPSCDGLYASFLLRGVQDGNYQLNENNQMSYLVAEPNGSYQRYRTDDRHTGMLVITSSTHEQRAVLQGKFSATLIDTERQKTIVIEDGSFLLYKQQF